MQLNHLDLVVPDVQRASEFFETFLGFRCEAMKGRQALAILKGEGGFTLVLSNLGEEGPPRYPKQFHLGFLQKTQAEVRALYERFTREGVEIVYPLNERRGSLMFYCHAPGQVLIEVSAPLSAPAPTASPSPES